MQQRNTSNHGDAAVDAIAHWHYPSDSEVRVRSAVEPPYVPLTTTDGGDLNLYGQMDENARAMARAAVDKAAAMLRAGEGDAHSTSPRKSSPARQRE